MLFQGVQKCFRISVLISAVESQVNPFLVRVFRIISVILSKFFKRGVCDRRLPLFLKT